MTTKKSKQGTIFIEPYMYSENFGVSTLLTRKKEIIDVNRLIYTNPASVATEDNAWKLQMIKDNADLSIFLGHDYYKKMDGLNMTDIDEEERKQKERINKFFKQADEYHIKIREERERLSRLKQEELKFPKKIR